MDFAFVATNKPPIDVGILIAENLTIWRVSLIFFDLLIDLKERHLAISIGTPWIASLTFLFSWPSNRQ
jgi:hypothetical protein